MNIIIFNHFKILTSIVLLLLDIISVAVTLIFLSTKVLKIVKIIISWRGFLLFLHSLVIVLLVIIEIIKSTKSSKLILSVRLGRRTFFYSILIIEELIVKSRGLILRFLSLDGFLILLFTIPKFESTLLLLLALFFSLMMLFLECAKSIIKILIILTKIIKFSLIKSLVIKIVAKSLIKSSFKLFI